MAIDIKKEQERDELHRAIWAIADEEVREHAKRIKAAGTRRIITGHCTGEEQYKWLKDELEKDSDIVVEQMCCGKEFVI